MVARLYTDDDRGRWNDFVATSANGTFLHRREYIEYHGDRMTDSSILIEKEANGRLVAILPANREGETLVSHRGLTYGGLIVGQRHLPDIEVERMIDSVLDLCRHIGIRKLIYRPVPHIYHRVPAEADIYALLCKGASLTSAATSAIITLQGRRLSNESMRQAAIKARREGLTVRRTDALHPFYEMLTTNLAERHNARPVHSLGELEQLRAQFPENIIPIGVFTPKMEMCAGILLYYTDTAVRTQYIASTETGRSLGAIPLAIDELRDELTAEGYDFIDMGTSIDPATGLIDPGLSSQKYSLGARPTVCPELTLDIV